MSINTIAFIHTPPRGADLIALAYQAEAASPEQSADCSRLLHLEATQQFPVFFRRTYSKSTGTFLSRHPEADATGRAGLTDYSDTISYV